MMTKGGKSKVRFDGLDVAAMATQLQRTLLGRRIINIYDGVSDNDSFLLKLDGQDKPILFLESGIRIHTTSHQASLQQEGMPSPFCSKLRKHLRGLRLERIAQLGNHDRVLLLSFGSGTSRHSLILELYARGNLVLTSSEYEILALLRSHDYGDGAAAVKVGMVYPVTHATSLTGEDGDKSGLLNMTATQAIEWATTTLAPATTSEEAEAPTKKKKSDSGIPLKALLLKPSSGVYHYGPSLLEHCILCAMLDPNIKFKADTASTLLDESQWDALLDSLKDEGSRIMTALSTNQGQGYILYRPKDGATEEEAKDKMHNKVLQEFQPHLLKQHEGRLSLKYDSFSEAVDDFFAHIGGQKQALRAQAAETAARERLEKIRRDQTNRVVALQKEQEVLLKHAQLVEVHSHDVEKALQVINSALDTGMDWEALEQLVEAEQANQNPIALLIKRLELPNDNMVLSLPNDDGKNVDVTISLNESAHGNASAMFSKYRAAKTKSVKTVEASAKAIKAAEATALRDLNNAQKQFKAPPPQQKKKVPWYTKFHWMVTSDNYLVVGGRDAQQNEQLVKRYLRPGDAYLHADVHGASSCILRAKRKRTFGGKTQVLPLPEQALREAGNFCICHSSAWTSRMVTSAWWVESHQVSKTAPTGEYLVVGSFMVRGKKNYLPPTPLEMGLAVLFRLGDEDSIARHLNERRDFSLLNDEDDEEVMDDKDSVKKVDSRNASPTKKRADLRDASARGDDVETYEEIGTGEKGKETRSPELNEEDDSASPEQLKEPSNDLSGEATEVENGDQAESNVTPADETNASSVDQPASVEKKKKKGLSVKDRKLIKRYGSLEAAEEAIAEAKEAEAESAAAKSSSPAKSTNTNNSQPTPLKRGKKSKLKRAAKKYADQDDEDRELALLALHAGEKDKKKNGKNKANAPVSEAQKKVAEDTTALLLKDPQKVAEQLPPSVQEVLSKCIAVPDPDASDPEAVILRWDKFDADVLEQLLELDLEEQQLAAAKRLLVLKQTTRVDNFSASLAGIVRTIIKYGHENLETELEVDGNDQASKRKTKAEKDKDEQEWKAALAEEGVVDEDVERDAIDDTAEISKLTGKPHPEDSLLYAVPVCAPYSSLSQYKYRVKLTPGNQKRGKAAKQCVEILTKSDGDKTTSAEQQRALIKHVLDQEWVQAICGDVKISAAGASKVAKKQKASGKKGKKKK